MKVNIIFNSIQGEGRYQGMPVVFIRLSGCTRKCSFCDTTYHTEYKEMSVEEVIEAIKEYRGITTVVWTGGEPLLQLREIEKVFEELNYYDFHIETNGDLIKDRVDINRLIETFDYVCISPKELKVAKRVSELIHSMNRYHLGLNYDIKVVTDLKEVGTGMIAYSTMLMPLSTYDEARDLQIKKDVWTYCVHSNKYFSARLHTMYGKKRGV